ncbi:MAG TPA: AMP-binding protein [Tepidisphaeraceae bacterium]|jgi:acyl-CoA synthetase (AMP-forming)/AMP-acid ligase II/acyl carrier protein
MTMSPTAPAAPHDSTWVRLLRRRAASEGACVAYRFLADGEAETASITVAELDTRARAIAAMLQTRTQPGDRVILAHAPGLDFIAAFFGCLYAGVVAVPTFPPRTNGNGHRMTARARAIVDHAEPSVVLTCAADVDRITTALAANVPVVGSDTVATDSAAAWQEPTIGPQTLACLQYTSGTSGTPKGVMLTHAALLANCQQIHERFETNKQSVGVVWLPPYHDMGLVGGILEPLYVGFDIVLMPPQAFLQKPSRWLTAVSRYRATITGGPCFAFGLCAAQVSDADAGKLDLSSLKVTFTGAETVRSDVLNKFAAKFAGSGFDPRSTLACYGMAETTLIVTGVRVGRGLSKEKPLGAEAEHVSCGPVVAPAKIVIVDPATRQPLPDGRVGEVWTHGPSVAAGYWQNPLATATTFAARLADDSGPFVRTGDLGFVRDAELFVTGRLKELIIVRGVNHAPHEIERTIEEAHAAVQAQGVAAFSIDSAEGEKLGLAIELQRNQRHADPAELVAAVRTAVAEAHGLEAHHVVLLKPGGLPRTPSGKVQRSACREGLFDGTLEPTHASVLADAPPAAPFLAPDLPVSAETADISDWLVAVLASALNATPDQIDPTHPVGGYGLGSADAVGFAGTISTRLGIDLPATTLWDYPTLSELAAYINELLTATASSAEAA